MLKLHPALLAPALAACLRADDALGHARRAQELLGSSVWSRVVRIENASDSGAYPATVYALVFEMTDALWLYIPSDGTQSLSTRYGRVQEDEADIGPLLIGIDPGFTSWAYVPADAPASKTGRPPNACFIESLALLRRRIEAGLPAGDPRLLSYYVQTPSGLRGHTVLQFRGATGWVVIDPHRPRALIFMRVGPTADAQASALGLRRDVASARWLVLGRWAEARFRWGPGAAARAQYGAPPSGSGALAEALEGEAMGGPSAFGRTATRAN